MGRFSPAGYQRLAQAMPGSLDVAFAGAEANVGVTIAQLGGRAEFVSVLPNNPLGDAACAALRALKVGVEHVVRTEEGRCGLYFVETGANQRGGLVIYDRDGSAFAISGPERYDWNAVLRGASWFHVSGISTAVSPQSARATGAAVAAARQAGLMVSYDLNFRRKLWRWEPGTSPEILARKTMAGILPDIDVLLGSAQDIAGMTGIGPENFDAGGKADPAGLARAVSKAYPRLQWIGMTLRENHSASRNRWGALLYQARGGQTFLAPRVDGKYQPYDIEAIVDRVGTGDVFSGALIFALQAPDLADPDRAIAFASAAGCLAHSIKGDFFYGTRAEVEALVRGDGAGYVSR